MAVDNRPFKSKEQDGQGNEVIIRDQQLVEQGTATTMASGAYFETRDVDDRPVKIPRDNMMNIVLECIGIILNDSSRNLGTNVQKALGLQGNTVGHSTVADFASVLGVVNLGASGVDHNPDSMTTPGFYYGGGRFIFILRHGSYTNIVWQFEFGWSGGPSLSMRYSIDTGVNWTEWKQLVNS